MMFISSFWVGVITTILVEAAFVVIFAVVTFKDGK